MLRHQPLGDIAAEDLTQAGLTAEQIQSAIAYQHPATRVRWSPRTERALKEWHESGQVWHAWHELTGAWIDPWGRPSRYGPSHTGGWWHGGFGSDPGI